MEAATRRGNTSAPEAVALLYPDLIPAAFAAALREAGVPVESEWSEDLRAAHAKM